VRGGGGRRGEGGRGGGGGEWRGLEKVKEGGEGWEVGGGGKWWRGGKEVKPNSPIDCAIRRPPFRAAKFPSLPLSCPQGVIVGRVGGGPRWGPILYRLWC